MFLGTRDNYHEIGENNVLCPKYIAGGMRGTNKAHCTFFVLLFKKTEKVQEHALYLNQILHHFNLICFSRMNNKNFTKGGHRGTHSYFFTKWICIVVLIYFIAILLTPGIFLIQIVNTKMYLIHFHCKNIIKMHFPKSWVFKVSKLLQTFIIHRNVVK